MANYGDMNPIFKTLGVTQKPVPLPGTNGKYGKYDAIIKGKKGNYGNLDGKIVSKMNDYDAYHATKGKVNRQLGKY